MELVGIYPLMPLVIEDIDSFENKQKEKHRHPHRTLRFFVSF
jgi:hypothetical protein